MMPGSSRLVSMHCAGSTPNGWGTNWTPSRSRIAPLKAYTATPDKRRRVALRARFDSIFRRRTGFATLDRLLARLHANKAALLMVLERPEIPLHTNGSE